MRPPIFAIRSIFLAVTLVLALALWGAGSASAQVDQFTPLGPSQLVPDDTAPVNPNLTGQGPETSEASSSSSGSGDVPTGASGHIESTGTSDSLGNVTSRALDNSIGEYWQKYPISRYGLDYHVTGVSTSPVPEFIGGDGIDFSGIPAMIASVVTKVIWWGCIFAAYGALALFEFAFNFNLLAGENSVLDPVSSAIEAFDKAIGNEFLAITITIFGLWAIWRALVQRRYGEVAGGFAASTLVLIAAIAFTLNAQAVVGFASDTLDATTQKFLSIAGALAPEGTGPRGSDVDIDSGELAAIQSGNVDDGTLHATDALFKLLVYDNFVVLNYGGLEHCAKTGNKVDEDNPATSQAVSGCPDQDGSRASNSGGWNLISNAVYANRYLSYPQGDARRCCGDTSEYRAISDGDSGKLPKGKDLKGASPPPPAYSPSDLGRADSPATDFQQSPSQFERLGMVFLTAFFVWGGVFLIVGLSMAVVMSKLLFLLVLAFAPIIAVLSFIPQHGPEIGLGWLKRLAVLAAAALYYSVLVAMAVALAFSLLGATSDLGWLMATGLTGLLFWMLFFYRNKIQELMTSGAARAGGGLGRNLATAAAIGGGLLAGKLAAKATGKVLKGGAKAGSAVGRQGIKTAMAPAASARAALDAPGRYKDMYRGGRERGMGVRRSAATASSASFDRQGAKAKGWQNHNNNPKRKAAVKSEYDKLRAGGMSAAEAKGQINKSGMGAVPQSKIDSLRTQSQAHDRDALNKHLGHDEQYRPGQELPGGLAAGAGSGNGANGDRQSDYERKAERSRERASSDKRAQFRSAEREKSGEQKRESEKTERARAKSIGDRRAALDKTKKANAEDRSKRAEPARKARVERGRKKAAARKASASRSGSSPATKPQRPNRPKTKKQRKQANAPSSPPKAQMHEPVAGRDRGRKARDARRAAAAREARK